MFETCVGSSPTAAEFWISGFRIRICLDFDIPISGFAQSYFFSAFSAPLRLDVVTRADCLLALMSYTQWLMSSDRSTSDPARPFAELVGFVCAAAAIGGLELATHPEYLSKPET